MARVQGYLLGGGLVPNPVRVGPLVPGNKTTTYLAPVHIARQVFTNVVAAGTTAILLAKTGAALPAAAGTITLVPDGSIGVAAIPTPRNVVITVTHATSIVAANGVITGRDDYGNVVTEAWAVTATGTTKTFTGAKAFASVSSITYVTAANAQANTIIAGTGVVLGLQFASACISAIKEIVAGSVVTNGVLTTSSVSAAADLRGTYTPNTVPNGATTYEVFYLVLDPSTGLSL